MNTRCADYCADVGLLVRHGMPHAEAAALLATEPGAGQREARIAARVAAGDLLSDALHEFGVPPWARAVVAAGEIHGALAQSLDLVARHLKSEAAWRDRMTKVTAYPLVVTASSVLIGLILCRTVLPTLAAMVEDLGASLPLASRIALAIGHAGSSPLVWVVASGLVVAVGWLIADDERLRAVAPHLRGVRKMAELAEAWRYFGVLVSLVEASVPMDRAMELAAPVVSPPAWRRGVVDLARRVRAGDSPSSAAREVRWLPPRTARLLAVAEAAGAMPEALASLRDHAETALSRRLDTLARWTPVVMLAIAAAVVGFLAQALLLPAFQIDLPA